jgi:RHS repeat-associated protein
MQASAVDVTVLDTDTTPQIGLKVYAFTSAGYTGVSGTTNEYGQVVFVLPEGSYRFRADLNGTHFWSGEENHCTIPGCESAVVELPGAIYTETAAIDYTYDPLYRLTAADYDTGIYFHYTYDAVGNRLSQTTDSDTTNYTYDTANRLTAVDSQSYTWDNNGNMLSDGTTTYTYDHANRLITATQGGDSYSFAYYGLGDRLQQTVNSVSTNYTLDLAAHLTEVISDGDSTFLNGLGRIGEKQTDQWAYHLPDAIGSVRQLADSEAQVTFAQSYTPFGEVLSTYGEDGSSFGYAGEWVDETGLVYLRARYYNTGVGRFIQPDPFKGIAMMPNTYNPYQYAFNNPLLYTDPSGELAGGIAIALSNPATFAAVAFGLIAAYVIFQYYGPAICEWIKDITLHPPSVRPKVRNMTWEDIYNLPEDSTNPKTKPKPQSQPKKISPITLPDDDESKKCNPANAAIWKILLKIRENIKTTPDALYEKKYTGIFNYLACGGGASIWADGVRISDCHLLDAKYVTKKDISPYVPGSRIDDYIRELINTEEEKKMRAYSAIIRDPSTPMIGLEIITNEPLSIPFWKAMMAKYGIPRPRVEIRP